MKERPIIFGGESVRAILAGTKTQTRRVMTPQPDQRWGSGVAFPLNGLGVRSDAYHVHARVAGHDRYIYCPQGKVGDRLWVRETFAIETNHNITSADEYPPSFSDGRPIRWQESDDYGRWWEQCHYRATEPTNDLVFESDTGEERAGRWAPSIFMPRWASRLTLEVTQVRVQRLQEISEEDAKAEGCGGYVYGHGPVSESDILAEPGYLTPTLYRNGFRETWDSINGKRAPWSSNPWVWAITFKRLP